MVAPLPEKAGAGPPRGLWFFEPARRSAEAKHALLEAYQVKNVSLGFQDQRGGVPAFYEPR